MLQSPYGEQYQPDHRRQGHHHKPMRPRVLHAEEVGEANSCYPPEDQNGPQDSGDTLLRCDQTHPPCVGQSLDLVQSFCVELLVCLRVWLELLKVCAYFVDKGPPCRSPLCLRHQGRLALLHQRPLLVAYLLGVGSSEFLDVRTFGLREPMGQPEDLGYRVGLLLDRCAGRLVFSPHGDDHEREQHGVDHTQGRVDEACNVVVGLAGGGGYEALHQLQPTKREEASTTDHKYAINYGECQRGSPPWWI